MFLFTLKVSKIVGIPEELNELKVDDIIETLGEVGGNENEEISPNMSLTIEKPADETNKEGYQSKLADTLGKIITSLSEDEDIDREQTVVADSGPKSEEGTKYASKPFCTNIAMGLERADAV